MRVIPEEIVTPTVLQSTNVVNIETTWSAGTYNLGIRRVFDRRVYEVVASPSTSAQPDVGAAADPPSWVELGFSNQWRMFTEGADSISTRDGDITATIEFPGLISTVGVLGVSGKTITLTVTDSVDGVVFSEVKDLQDIGVADWWEWYFLPYDRIDKVVFNGIPPYAAADINLLLEGATISDPVHIGRVVAGVSRDIGVVLYDTDIKVQDYSIKSRDGFGNLKLQARRSIALINYNVHIFTDRIDFVTRVIKRLAGLPALYVGEEALTSTITFGVFTDVSTGISTPSKSELILQVEEF